MHKIEGFLYSKFAFYYKKSLAFTGPFNNVHKGGGVSKMSKNLSTGFLNDPLVHHTNQLLIMEVHRGHGTLL